MTTTAKWELSERIERARRRTARAALPLTGREREDLCVALRSGLRTAACEHSLGRTTAWLARHGIAPGPLLDWCREAGAGCDCEILDHVCRRPDDSSR